MIIHSVYARAHFFAALIGVAALGVAVGHAPIAQAQKYPVKAIRLLVGSAAGGGLDAAARVVAAKYTEILGQSMLIENRTGAGGALAAGAVASAPPDGYTLLYSASTLLIMPSVIRNLAFDPVKSFTPIGGVGSDPLVIVVNNAVPAKSTTELIALLKANPGKYSYGTTGIGTVHHLSMELFRKQTNTEIVHIPYKGAAAIIPDLISGVLPMAIISLAAAVPQAKAGKLRTIAHTRPGRSAIAPDLPPIADELPGFDAAPAQFILAPAGTSPEVVARLSEGLKTLLSADDTRQFFLKQGATLEYLSPDALAARMRVELPLWTAVAKDAGVKPE